MVPWCLVTIFLLLQNMAEVITWQDRASMPAQVMFPLLKKPQIPIILMTEIPSIHRSHPYDII
jgi:hypothetical protein